ncbi:MAG: zinc ribbon domain-containing protein [Clostridia bacterium]|nr:zinc ribbon domain-containing protein [Clostridia bacterium]
MQKFAKALEKYSSSIDIKFKVNTKMSSNFETCDYFAISFDYEDVKKALLYYFGLIYNDDNTVVPADRKFINEKYGLDYKKVLPKCEKSQPYVNDSISDEKIDTEKTEKISAEDEKDDYLDDLKSLIPFILAGNDAQKRSLMQLLAFKSVSKKTDIARMILLSQMIDVQNNKTTLDYEGQASSIDISYADGMLCTKCNIFYPIGTEFCSKCGNSTIKSVQFCKKCGYKASLGDVFCRKCGTSLTTLS